MTNDQLAFEDHAMEVKVNGIPIKNLRYWTILAENLQELKITLNNNEVGKEYSLNINIKPS
jgi:hypothetical protein